MATSTSEIKDSSGFVVSIVEDVLQQNINRSSDVGVVSQRVEESLPDDEFSKSESSLSAEETSSTKKSSNQNLPPLNVEKKRVSEEDQREKLKQSEFVQGILSSVILEDDL